MTEANWVPVTICWHCDRPLDAASGVEDNENERPTPGAISLCMYCGAVAIFGSDLKLLPPTEPFLDELGKDSKFRNMYTRFSWARQYLMIRDNLMRDRSKEDE